MENILAYEDSENSDDSDSRNPTEFDSAGNEPTSTSNLRSDMESEVITGISDAALVFKEDRDDDNICRNGSNGENLAQETHSTVENTPELCDTMEIHPMEIDPLEEKYNLLETDMMGLLPDLSLSQAPPMQDKEKEKEKKKEKSKREIEEEEREKMQ